ncbi:MAG: hypothetical protein AAGJ83_11335 [Planctomycetota bacterium]
MNTDWKTGDWAVYRKSKSGANPGRRASQVVASSKGETYRYVVDKFWVVDEVLSDGKLRLVTARGKRHTISADDPNLRRPGIVQRFFWRERFAVVEAGRTEGSELEPATSNASESVVPAEESPQTRDGNRAMSA